MSNPRDGAPFDDTPIDVTAAAQGGTEDVVRSGGRGLGGFSIVSETTFKFAVDGYRKALGDAYALVDPHNPEAKSITDVYRNPDSDTLWIESTTHGTLPTKYTQSAEDAMSMIDAIAGAYGRRISPTEPKILTIVPGDGARFTAKIPPIVGPGPTWLWRKPIRRAITLDDYLKAGIADKRQVSAIIHAVKMRKNIAIVGPPRAGKTTLTNAVLAEIGRQFPTDRMGIIEDTPELVRPVANGWEELVIPEIGHTWSVAINESKRMNTVRLILGEIRDAAQASLKAFTAGYDGSVATWHGRGSLLAMYQYEAMLIDDGVAVSRPTIASAFPVIVAIDHYAMGRIITHVESPRVVDGGWTFDDLTR